MITLGSLCIVFDGDAIIGTLIGEALMVFFLFFLPMLLLTRGRDAETTVNPRRSGGSTQGSCSFDAIFDTQTGNIGAGYYDVWGSAVAGVGGTAGKLVGYFKVSLLKLLRYRDIIFIATR